jgi:hemerythrin
MKYLNEHFTWTPEMALGNPKMDIAHRAFVERISAMMESSPTRFVVEFPALVREIEEDFHEEEILMEAIDFPSLLPHREQHARVLSGLHHVLPRVLAGDTDAGKQTLDLLSQWFSFHLMTMDAALACALDMAKAQPEVPMPETERSMLDEAVRRARFVS